MPLDASMPNRPAVTSRLSAPAGLLLAAVFAASAAPAFARAASINDQLSEAFQDVFPKSSRPTAPARAAAQADTPAQGGRFAAGSSYELCFVPDGPGCETLLVNAIRAARQRVLVQAYVFTSTPIAKALIQAHERGVDVRVILDKSQVSERYTSATLFRNAGIPVAIDSKPAIAHNKVMVFDDSAVFTGSFNFTRSAQERNAENGMLVRGDLAVARAYAANWEARLREASAY